MFTWDPSVDIQTDRQADKSEHIALPQLCWQAVNVPEYLIPLTFRTAFDIVFSLWWTHVLLFSPGFQKSGPPYLQLAELSSILFFSTWKTSEKITRQPLSSGFSPNYDGSPLRSGNPPNVIPLGLIT